MNKQAEKLMRKLVIDASLRSEIEAIVSHQLPVFAQAVSEQHARVIAAQQFTLHVTDIVGANPRLQKSFASPIKNAKANYLPSYPPMSPVTKSFFDLWGSCDFQIKSGSGAFTAAQCAVALARRLKLEKQFIEDCEVLSRSRLGFYEVVKVSDEGVGLREIPTQVEVRVTDDSGYEPKASELWLARIAVFAAGESINLITPYVIVSGATREDLLQFFSRYDLSFGASNLPKLLDRFMKRPKDPAFWHEYVVQGYVGHTDNAIFLRGVPDIPETLPHSDEFTLVYNAN